MIIRLRGRRAFRHLHREGTRVRTRWLWCTMLLDPTTSDTEVGYAIGRAAGPAVARNRLRRRLRALLAARADRLPGGALLIGVHTSTATAAAASTWAELGASVDELLDAMAARTPVTPRVARPDQVSS